MIYRQACVEDINEIQVVRNLVKENRLSDPSLVKDSDVEEYIIGRGRGWVAEENNSIVAFAIVSVKDNNVWALFVRPDFEKVGIGRILHDIMLNWYFQQTDETLWLSTAPGTRAEKFYRKVGWKDIGYTKNGETRFEMKAEEWKYQNKI